MTAAPILLESEIVRATVFSDAAHVVRRAQARLDPGLNRLALPDLPRHLDPARLRVATSAGVVRFVETDDVSWSEPSPPDSPGEARVADARKTVHRLRGERSALQAELRLIDRVAPGAGREGPLPRLRPDVFLAGLDALTKRRRATLYAIRVAEYELALAEQELEEAVALADAAGRPAGGARATIVVGVHAETEGPAEVDLTYTSGWATWRPYYALRLSEGGSRVEVARFADVWQESGEDWRDVDLVLSSAEPEERLQLPAATPWILELRRAFEDDNRALYASRGGPAKKRSAPPPPGAPSPARAPAPAPMMAEQTRSGLIGAVFEDEATADLEIDADMPDEMDAYAAQYEEEGIFAEITSAGVARSAPPPPLGSSADYPAPPPPPPVSPMGPGASGPRRFPPSDHPDLPRLLELALPRDASGGVDFELPVPGKTTCPSGRSHQRIGLGRASHDTKMQYLLRPSLKDHAFGRATVRHDEEVPLLAGSAALFVDDAFFGSTHIATTPSGGKLVLDLGAETSIKSARRSKTSVRTEGLINKDDVHTVEITIEIESYMDQALTVEVQDQIPVSIDGEVKVKLLETRPKGALDRETGVLDFEIPLTPGTPAQVTIRYEIEAPKDYKFARSLGDA